MKLRAAGVFASGRAANARPSRNCGGSSVMRSNCTPFPAWSATKSATRPTPIPLSTRRRNYLANLQGAVSEPLTDEEMHAIAGIDRNCRLIKGQVFLWRDGQTWEDLWDLHGELVK